MKFLLALLLVLILALPVMAGNHVSKDVYSYKMDEGFDSEAIHARILEIGIRDIAIGAGLYSIVHNRDIVIQPLLDEIEWVKRVAHAKTIWVIDYNESTRMGYEPDGVYRYCRYWDRRVEAMEKLGKAGVDYFIIDVGVMHYPAPSDITTYLLALQNVCEKYGMKFGVYDGDGVGDVLDFKMLEWAGIYIWSDIYISGDSAYLRSSCGWGYPYLVTLNYMGPGSWQFNELADFQVAKDLMSQNNFTGYNIIETYHYEGVLPDWWTGR